MTVVSSIAAEIQATNGNRADGQPCPLRIERVTNGGRVAFTYNGEPLCWVTPEDWDAAVAALAVRA